MSLDWMNARITQGYGPTDEKLDSGYKGYANFNLGNDYSLPVGTPIGANISGTVISVTNQGSKGWGLSVKVKDAQGNIHNYGHLSAANVKVGDKIQQGQVIGASGNTGASTGPHLSYDVKAANGEYVEPSQWVASGGGRAPAASGVAPVSQQEDSGDIFDRIGSLLGQAGQKAKTAQDAQNQRTLGAIPQATGDYATDAGAYWQAAQDAYTELAQYQATNAGLIVVDEGAGIVYTYDEDSLSEDGLVPDPVGTAILQRALLNVSNLDRLYAAKNAGLIQSGEGAAAAFLSSEKEKVAAASQKYDDYVKRVSDLVAIEDIPFARAASVGAALKAMNSNESGRTLRPGMGLSGRPATTDTSVFANAIKSTIPAQAPMPYNMDPSALEPIQPDVMKFPARPPDEILASVGLAGPPSVTLGQPQAPVPQTPGLPTVTLPQQQQPQTYNFGNMANKRSPILNNPTQTIDQVTKGILGGRAWQ